MDAGHISLCEFAEQLDEGFLLSDSDVGRQCLRLALDTALVSCMVDYSSNDTSMSAPAVILCPNSQHSAQRFETLAFSERGLGVDNFTS